MRLLRHAWAAAVLAAALLTAPAAELSVLPEGSAAQRIALGNEALMQKRYETAIEHYRRALAVDATSFQALFNLALAYQQLGQNEEARSWYEQANKVGQGHAEVLCNLGVLAFKARRLRHRRRALRRGRAPRQREPGRGRGLLVQRRHGARAPQPVAGGQARL